MIVGGTAWEQQPRGYRTESAAADVFSAERAFRTVEAIAQRPHPMGTAEHDRVRDHLVGELQNLGLRTEIQSGVGRYPAAIERDILGMGRVDNIVATLPGTNSTGTIYLAAHYDSVSSGPGANDDAVGVAAVLETLRALRASGATLRNDVVALLTDGEEQGLLGAEAFVAAHPELPRGVVINHEARGAGGAVLLWRTTSPDGALIRAVAAAAPHPNTDSLTTALAGGQTSSNTDYAALEPAGLQVMDWAFAGHSAYYHNRFDDPAHVDLATVQQMGDNALALARELGDQDLTTAAEDRPAYFQLPFGTLIVLPIWVIIALAVLGLIATGWVIRRAWQDGETGPVRVIAAAATAFVTVPVAMGAVYGLWEAIKAIRPEYRPLFVDPYRPEFYYAAIIMLAVGVLAAWYPLARRWFGTAATTVGLLSCVTVVGALVTIFAPAAAQVLIVPGAAAAVGVSATLVLPQRWQLPVLTVFLIPAAIFLGGTWSALQTGIAIAPFLVAPSIVLLGGLLALTLIYAWPARRGWAIPLGALVLTVALAGTGLAVDRFDDRHPLTSQLVYALDADRNEAQWLSHESPDRWTDNFVDSGVPESRFRTLWSTAVASGPAPAQGLSRPTAEILSDTTESQERTVRLRLHASPGTTSLALRYNVPIDSLRVAGREVTPVPTDGIQFHAPPAEGIEVELTAPARPLPLTLVDYRYLPDSAVTLTPSLPTDIYLRQDSVAAVFIDIPGL